MKRNFFTRTCLLAFACITMSANASAATIAQWDFNSNPSDSNTSTGITTPTIGSGIIGTVGGTTVTFASGDASGGSTDPNVGDDSAFNVTTWPAQGTGNKTAGIQFATSTAGYENILVTFDERHSNTSANTTRLQYTLDATAGSPVWVDGPQFTFVPQASGTGDTWFNNRSADLSSVAGLDNNANAAFRVVTEFDPALGGTAYLASRSTSTYGTTGTLRYDMITVSGSIVVPEAASVSLLCLALSTLAIARRGRMSVK
ncbi:MAG: hypothetical protein IT425_08715 [Pirellulales bacterium]|nr:hypothetical protein [Pirellulales bacterium]